MRSLHFRNESLRGGLVVSELIEIAASKSKKKRWGEQAQIIIACCERFIFGLAMGKNYGLLIRGERTGMELFRNNIA